MSPADTRRELAAALKVLRTEAGLSTTVLADRLGWSQSKVSKIENGRTKPAIADVTAWLKALRTPRRRREELVELARSLHAAVAPYGMSLDESQHHVRALEADARELRNFQTTVVPGLLQTAEYARRIFEMINATQPLGDVGVAVAARLDRQAILYDESRHIELLIAEAALRRPVGPAPVMLAQYDRILSVATLATITIGVLPLDAVTSAWLVHGFMIYRPVEQAPFVAVETLTRGLTLTDPEEVAMYEREFEQIRAAAVFDDDARELIAMLRADLAR